MKLETKRLVLRLPEEKDAVDVVKGIGNIEVSKWLLMAPYPYTMKDAKWWIQHCGEKAEKKPREAYSFNIELKEEGKIIGGIEIDKVDKFQKAGSIGYWLATDYHRKGLMSEAVEEMLALAFERLKLRRLEAEIFAGNAASAGILKKFGFQYEGTKVQAVRCKATGKIHDAEIYGILREEWEK